ncbi:hypothetical protein JTE90_008548 [Oedothorax gibbosus]|uniref:Uncharacterized protein n=1 Tax=Oedothorax gibbosus TaxID=931172 RepID=A0AAV6VJM8_9ARAC|nr:hypothetical protein JTE90_008548 [Oedothorax gibbosus]
MHSISSRWRKPVSNKAKKKAAATANAKKQWQKEPSANVSCSMPQPPTSPVAVMDFPPELVTTASTSYTLIISSRWRKPVSKKGQEKQAKNPRNVAKKTVCKCHCSIPQPPPSPVAVMDFPP